LGIETDGVESITAGLDPHLVAEEPRSAIRECRGIDERLGDGLHRERLARVAHRISHAVHCDEADSEPFGIGLRELRYVACEPAAMDTGELAVKLGQEGLDGGLHAVAPTCCANFETTQGPCRS